MPDSGITDYLPFILPIGTALVAIPIVSYIAKTVMRERNTPQVKAESLGTSVPSNLISSDLQSTAAIELEGKLRPTEAERSTSIDYRTN